MGIIVFLMRSSDTFRPIPRPVVIKLEGEENWPDDLIFSADNKRVDRSEVVQVRNQLKEQFDSESVDQIKGNKEVARSIGVISAVAVFLYFATASTSSTLVCPRPGECYYEREKRYYHWILIVAFIAGLFALKFYWNSWRVRLEGFTKVQTEIAELNNGVWRSRGLEWSLNKLESTVVLKGVSSTQQNIILQDETSNNVREPFVSA
eukprot:TRINITY_DN373_c0_g1_i10.p1 TRINITY_DN373_c0_g1~~TRINITY_DN373_c0_g1_i10.p1  ORF type:complete len:206 (+),score=16.64 TRINITY_DN373_c0_g1_i10:382-999(+)